MAELTREIVLRILNVGETGTWRSLQEVRDSIAESAGTWVGKEAYLGVVSALLNELISYGHVISNAQEDPVRYAITPKGQDWLTKNGRIQTA